MKAFDALKQKKYSVMLGLAILLAAFTPMPVSQIEPKTVHIPISASSFSFTPGVINVNPGDRVVIELTSTDVVHGIYLDGYDLSVTSDPGQPAQLSFTADKAGTYRFRCSITCGALHPFMIGKIKVGDNMLMLRGSVIVLLIAAVGVWRLRDEK
jgi:cytochrome c oxidase subunit 2